MALTGGNIGTLVRHRGLALPYLIWLSAVGADALLTRVGSKAEKESGMALVDDRGRVFGRFNPVDVFMFALVVVMIPIAYGAYALFRTPPAKLGGIEPKQFTVGPNLRVGSAARTSARSCVCPSTGTGPHVHDRQHRRRPTSTCPSWSPAPTTSSCTTTRRRSIGSPKALTMLPRVAAPTVTLSVDGRFVGLNQAQVDALRPGAKFGPNDHANGTLLSVGPRIPGALQMRTGETGIAVGMPGLFDVAAALELECCHRGRTDGSVRCTVYGPRMPLPWSRTRSCPCRWPAAR